MKIIFLTVMLLGLSQTPSDAPLLTISVPEGATVHIDGVLSKVGGTTRNFYNPNLPPGDHTYTVKVDSIQNNQFFTETKQVTVSRGKTVMVPFLERFARTGNYPLDLLSNGLYLPQTDDQTLMNILHARHTVFYKLPQVYQHHTKGAFLATYLPQFNANSDFPWEGTVGLNSALKRKDNPYEAFNFYHLPLDSAGKPIPILVTKAEPRTWIFPEGTVVGEIIYVKHKGKNWIQEVRTRTKDEGSLLWSPRIYRPVLDRYDYYVKTGTLFHPEAKHFFFRNLEEDLVMEIKGLVEKLPPLAEDKVKDLLTLPFKDATRKPWSQTSFAPTSDQDFHIVPKDYSLGVLKPAAGSCMQCHRQTSISVKNLIPREKLIQNNPASVGRIRGSDGIFTWYPFAEGVARKDETSLRRPSLLRQYDISKGYLREFELKMLDTVRGVVKIGNNEYKLTKAVQDALLEELPPSPFLHD